MTGGHGSQEDRQAIAETLYRYAHAVDRLDLDLVRACYTPDAYDLHGGYRGDIPGLIEDMRRRHLAIDSSQHFITNVLIAFHDAGASVESYCLCFLRSSVQDDEGRQTLSRIRCRYLDDFRQVDGQWLIADRVVVFDEIVDTPIWDSVASDWVASHRHADRVTPAVWVDPARGRSGRAHVTGEARTQETTAAC